MTDYVGLLSSFENFREVPREQIEWLVRESDVIHYPPGLVRKPGETFSGMMVVVKGTIQAYAIQNGQKRVMMTINPGETTGILPFSRMKASPVYADALEAVVTLELATSKFPDLLRSNYELVGMLVHNMTDRVRHFTTAHFQDEKLMALGKLSAGVAHELNNPAAAIQRSAKDLESTLAPLLSDIGKFSAIHLSPEQMKALQPLVSRSDSGGRVKGSLMQRKQQEDDLLDWLDDHGIPVDDVEAFLEYGYTCSDLDTISKIVEPSQLPAIVSWLAQSLDARQSIEEISIASRRISELVQSVKNYTRMDQVQDMQEMQINEGIRNTLTMLQHKMRRNSVTLEDDLAEGLPTISGFPGELNQVWTNIVDNALDAMKEGGTLRVRTYRENGCIVFSATDSGVGIRKEDLDRIFDPFFTTKDVGEGTGVGLDLVQKIVKVHHGTIAVSSEPGNTEFKISFPVAHN